MARTLTLKNHPLNYNYRAMIWHPQIVHIILEDFSLPISNKFKAPVGIIRHRTQRGPLETGERGKEKSG